MSPGKLVIWIDDSQEHCALPDLVQWSCEGQYNYYVLAKIVELQSSSFTALSHTRSSEMCFETYYTVKTSEYLDCIFAFLSVFRPLSQHQIVNYYANYCTQAQNSSGLHFCTFIIVRPLSHTRLVNYYATYCIASSESLWTAFLHFLHTTKHTTSHTLRSSKLLCNLLHCGSESLWRCRLCHLTLVNTICQTTSHTPDGLVGVTYVGVAYSKWIVVVLPSLLMSAGNESPFCLCACHCLQEPVPMSLCHWVWNVSDGTASIS